MCFKWAGRGRLCQQHSPPLVLISFTSSKLDPMWLTVSEDPHGRIRYHQDLYPRGTRRSQNGCPSFPEPVYSSYPSYSSGRYTVDLEREEYDNVNPDSPIPQYYYHHTNYCSPGTSSSSNYEEEYPIPVDSRDSSSIYRDNSSIYRESASIYRENYPIYQSSSIMTRYSEEPRREPVVPSPDYSPPVNRVRFLDQELYSNGYSTYRKPKQSYGTIDSRRRGAESQTKNDYQRRLQTSASDADLSRYSVKSRSSSVPFTDGKGSSLKQARRFLKERIFNSVAARETRAPVSASTVFSNVPPPPSSYSNGVTPVGTIAPHVEKTPVTSGGSFFNRKKKKDKKPRIRKEDISNPTNFQHKAHVGWDQDSGFSNNVDSDPMDESIKEIIRAAGQDPNNLSKKTIKFVYDFIERYEDTSVASPGPAQFSRQQAPPPPVPLSQPISQWNTPPPAPPSRGASYQSSAPPSRPPPPPPSTGKFNSRPLPQVPSIPDNVRPAGMPPPPPPMGSVAPMGGSIPPPPPPPPPISSSAPAPPPPPPAFSNSSAPAPPSSTRSAMPAPQSGRGDLLAQIQAGKQLRSVAKAEESKSTGGSDSRDDVMAQIRLGANLKHVDQAAEQEKRKSGPALAEMGGIAGALAKALEERRMNMCIDSSDDEEESDEKNEWSD